MFQLTDYELCIASNLVDPLSLVMSWSDIGGLDETIEEIRQSVIIPFQRADLFAHSKLLQPPKGKNVVPGLQIHLEEENNLTCQNYVFEMTDISTTPNGLVTCEEVRVVT